MPWTGAAAGGLESKTFPQTTLASEWVRRETQEGSCGAVIPSAHLPPMFYTLHQV